MIGCSLEEQNSITNDIATSLLETTQGSAQIADAIECLETLVQQATDAVEHVRTSASHVADLNEAFHNTQVAGSKEQVASSR